MTRTRDARVEAFLEGTRAPDHWRGIADHEALGEALERAIRAGRESWPKLALPDLDFARAIGECLAGEEARLDAFEGLRLGDLYLARACAANRPGAAAALEERHFGALEGGLRRLRMREADIEDALQRLRHRLFLGHQGGRPKIAAYTGRGQLGGWLRVVAVRDAVKSQKREARGVVLADDTHAPLDASALGHQETERLDGMDRPLMVAAVREALVALPDREKTVLRQHYLDGISLDRLAEMHGVHRATVARWIQQARGLVVSRMKQILAERNGLSRSELESMLGLAQQPFDVTLSRVLRTQTRDA